jgi:aspartyl-tRNA(Asn)/glutamyl-tRNA(Gln) amidotransferase subunit A
LACGLPVEIDRLTLNWHNPLATFETLWVAGRGIAYGKALKGRTHELDPGFAALIENARHYDLGDYLSATQQRAVFANQVHALFDTYDMLLLPTLPVLPFPAHLTSPEDRSADGDDCAVPWARWTPFTYPFNLSGNPAASLPCGWSKDDLPIGLQVVGPRHADAEVLQFCAAVEALLPWAHKLPPLLR